MSRHLKNFNNFVASQGCIICGKPAMLHHPRFAAGMGQRSSEWIKIPLCDEHHQYGGYGVAIHAGQEAFEANYGTEPELLSQTIERAFTIISLNPSVLN